MADVRAHHLEKVVDRIYGAVGDPETWGDVLQEIAEALGARGALIFRPSANASETQGFWSPSIDDLVDWAIRETGRSSTTRGLLGRCVLLWGALPRNQICSLRSSSIKIHTTGR
jgi:hypothetical protein